MATRRTYGDGCAIARGLDVVGERWALLVVRELLLGPKRYMDLERGLPNASPNVLSDRLRELERAGIVRRRTLAPPAGSRVYELTAWGHELEPVVMAIGHWAARSPMPSSAAPIRSADSVILAFRARFEPDAAHGLSAEYELRLGEDRFRIEVADDQLEITRGDADHPDVTICSDNDTIAAILWTGGSLAEAQRSGAITTEGDTGAVERLLSLFPMPRSADPAASA